MKKIIFAVLTIIAIAACNSPQEITSPGNTSTTTDSGTTQQQDTMLRGDSMKMERP